MEEQSADTISALCKQNNYFERCSWSAFAPDSLYHRTGRNDKFPFIVFLLFTPYFQTRYESRWDFCTKILMVVINFCYDEILPLGNIYYFIRLNSHKKSVWWNWITVKLVTGHNEKPGSYRRCSFPFFLLPTPPLLCHQACIIYKFI